MSKQTINIGASPNDGTGTPLRTSFDYTNQNFTEIYTALGGGVALPGATTQVIFNDGGTNLAGDAGLVYNKTTDALTVAGLVTAGSATITGAATVGTTLGVTGVSTLASAVVTGALTSGTTTLVSHAAGYTGKVGIGTATPATALQVVGEIRSSADISNSSDTIIYSFSGGTAGSVRAGLQLIGSTPEIRVYLSSATALTINSTSNLVLKGGTAAANGVGVTFPATQVASSDANCLDDYEEGTWTGTLRGNVLEPATLIAATGKYTKIGRQVTVSIYYNSVDTTGYSGNVTIDGLPFTGSESFAGSSITFGLFATSTTLASWNVSTSIAFYITGNYVTGTHSPGAGKYLTTTLTYFV